MKLVLKPFGEQWRKKRWWSKVELYPFERDVRVYTRKVDYGPVNLQLVADHCIGTMRSGVHWRVGTNFLQGGSKQKLKVRTRIPHRFPLASLVPPPAVRLTDFDLARTRCPFDGDSTHCTATRTFRRTSTCTGTPRLQCRTWRAASPARGGRSR